MIDSRHIWEGEEKRLFKGKLKNMFFETIPGLEVFT